MYAAVPLGVAVAADASTVWAAAAVLLATFYVNAVGWLFLAAVVARRAADPVDHPTQTTIPMPAGLVEGAETIVIFTLMLAFPDAALVWFWTMAALVAVTIAQRVRTARRWLSSGPRHGP